MKEEKLFDIVSSVDYDLICEALECSSNTEKKGEEYVGALYSVPVRPKKMYYWQYPVTAAALIIVLVGMLFIFNTNTTLPYNEEKTGGEQESTANTDNMEISASTETSEESHPSIGETTTHIVPDKVVKVGTVNVMYTNSYPEFIEPTAGEATFTEMSTSELMEYYEIDNILYGIEQGDLIEVVNENTSHGIYTFPDGSIYDINSFTFITSYDDLYYGKKFTVTVGRASTFGHEYDMEPDPVWRTTPNYYNEEKETFFGVYEKYGSCIMISGKVNELTDYDDVELKETYYNYNYTDVDDELWQGVPCELFLFNYDVALCLLDYNRE